MNRLNARLLHSDDAVETPGSCPKFQGCNAPILGVDWRNRVLLAA